MMEKKPAYLWTTDDRLEMAAKKKWYKFEYQYTRYNPQLGSYTAKSTVIAKTEKEAEFDAFSAAAKPFFENEAYSAYALAAFGIDSALLKEGCRAGEFVSAGTNAMYKEVTLPILADDVVRDFYGGKLSFGTLRRCIAAWLYFKLYRMGGAAKKLGCKVCSKLAGGDLNV